MNRVFDYLRLALKGRTKTPGQRLRASQLSYRMLGRAFPPSSPNLNTTVAFSILAMEACTYPGRFCRQGFCFCLQFTEAGAVYYPSDCCECATETPPRRPAVCVKLNICIYTRHCGYQAISKTPLAGGDTCLQSLEYFSFCRIGSMRVVRGRFSSAAEQKAVNLSCGVNGVI